MSIHRKWSEWRILLALALPAAAAVSVLTPVSSRGESERQAPAYTQAAVSESSGPEAAAGCTLGAVTKTNQGEEACEQMMEQASKTFSGEIYEEIPDYYNLAEMGKKPTVRSQGNTGTCWAISSVSALESDLLPDTDLVFSADHMSLQNGFCVTQEDGGDYYMIMSYLSDWKGPVLEEEDPYGDGVSPDGLSAAVHVQEVRLLKGMGMEKIKRMILKYGAAQSSLCLNRERTDTDDYHYYNAQTCAYFDPLMENVDHDILILGWDDSFPKENFRIQPPEDGAWICQNTWGESFGENGLFYVSYEDRNLFRKGGAVYNRIEAIDNYNHVYENDTLGWQGRQGFSQDHCWFAGAFTAASDEMLSAVGLYSSGPGTTCRIYLIPRFMGEEDLKALAMYDAERSETLSGVSESETLSGVSESESVSGVSEKEAENEPVSSVSEKEAESESVSSVSEKEAESEPLSGVSEKETASGMPENETEENEPDSEAEAAERPVDIIFAAQADLDSAGFFTIDLEEEIPLAAGQQFTVAVWIETEGETKPVAVEMIKDRYTQDVTFEGRHTWISPDALTWESTQEEYQTNVCLKAYTRDQEKS